MRIRSLACIAGWLAVAVVSSAADVQRPIRESVTLPVDSQVAKALFTVDEYLSEQRYDELTNLLTQLAETHGREVIAVPSDGNTPANRYVNVSQYCQRLLTTLPPAGRAVCRKRLDPPARRWWDAWQATRETNHLERILASAYISSFGDDALWALAEEAWDRGEFLLADSYWSQLDPAVDASVTDGLHYPDAEFAAADIQARRILAAIFSRQFSTAERKLSMFRDQYAEARGMIAGRNGRLTDLLAETLAEARTWKSAESLADAATFSGSAARQRRWNVKLDVGPLRWNSAWQVRNLPQINARMALDQGPLRLFPITDGQRVFVSDGDCLRAWNLLTGEPAWPNDQPEPAVIYPSVPEERIHLPYRPCSGVAWQTLTIYQGKLLARMGSPVTGPTQSERGDLVTELVCLDLRTGQGKLLWKLTEDDLSDDGPPWSFEGTPLVMDGTAYAVIYRRLPEPEYGLLAVDVETGVIRWQHSLGSARPVVEDAVNRVSHLLLTCGEGRLYLSTDQGAILALSPQDGKLLWAVSYDSQIPELLPGVPAHLQAGLLPPVFWNGLVLVAPNDTRLMFCLEASSGKILWHKRSPERLRSLIGIADQGRRPRLLASGNSLWAFDLDDGGLGWRMTQSEPEERGYGQGVLTDESLFWPSRDFLYQLNPSTGELERKIPLRTPDSAHYGGNLAVANGLLVIAEPNGIAVYGEYSRLKEKLQYELSQRPDEAVPWRQLMNLEASAGRWDAAAAAGRRAWQCSALLSEPAKLELQTQFCTVLQQDITRKMESEEWFAADELYRELSELPLRAADRGRLWWDWSRLDLHQGLVSEAVDRLHRSLALFEETRFDIGHEPANLVIRKELERLLQQHGRAPFRKVDAAAEQAFASAVSTGDIHAVRRVARTYPVLESAAEAWPRLIDDSIRRKNWLAVWPLLEEWQSLAETDLTRRLVQQQRIRALKAVGYTRSAAERTRMFAQPDAASLPLNHHVSPWQYLERSWRKEVAVLDRVVVPQGQPPADELACVLLSGDALRALDRHAGTERWRQPGREQYCWAGYGETHLLLASQDAVSARRLENGELVWEKRWQTATDQTVPDADALHLSLDRLILFDLQQGMTALSPVTGDLLWEFRPPRGKLQRRWSCHAERVILQTLEPSEFWIVSASDGKLLHSGAGTEHPWRDAPVSLAGDRFGFVTTNHLVSAWGPQRKDRWKFGGAISQAHAAPWIMRDGEHLGLVIDGSTLVGVDPGSGKRLWGSGLADSPLREPGRQVASSSGLVAAASHATLRAISLSDGRLAWEQPLPPGVETWRVMAWADFFAVTGSTQVDSQVLMFRAADGHPLQSLRQPLIDTTGDWRLDDHGALYASTQTITAWRPLVSQSSSSASADHSP